VRVAQVGTDGETVSDTAVEVDLPGLAGLDEGVLGFVTELGGEDLVDFCRDFSYCRRDKRVYRVLQVKHTRSSNGQRTSDATEFLVGDERGVSSVADVEPAVLQEAADVLAAKAVANTSNTLNTQFLSEVLDGALDNGVDTTGLVVGNPLGEVDLAGFHVANLDGVAVEEVGDDGQVAIVGELVSKELAVDEETVDVGEDDDGLVGVLVVFGVGDVGVDCTVLRSVLLMKGGGLWR